MKPKQTEFIIIGAGIGGLTAALALLQRGFDVQVFEQATQIGDVGAGVQISANGTRVLANLGLETQMRAVAFEPSGKEIRHWNTGQTWPLFDLGFESTERYGSPYLMFHRADLHNMLLRAVSQVDTNIVNLNARLVRFEDKGDTVCAYLSDGQMVSGDVLVGADGIHSVVRPALFGPADPQFTGCVAWRTVIPVNQLPAGLVRPVGTNWVGPGAHIVHYFLRRGELLNFVGITERNDWRVESWSTQGSVDELARDFAGWHDDIHRIIRSAQTQPYKWALLLRRPMEKWHQGRVTLLGDACHPTQPTMAQGAVMAIEDGLILARAFVQYGDDVEQALQCYEMARLERTNRVVQTSNDNVKRFHSQELREPESAGRFISAQWDPALVAKRYDWLFSYDPSTVEI